MPLLIWAFLGASPSAAGLYLPAEPMIGPRIDTTRVTPLPWGQLRSILADLEAIANPLSGSPERKRYLAAVERLKSSGSFQDAVDLGGYLIRLRRDEEAITILSAAIKRDRRNFMLYANLGTAYQRVGDLERAASALQDALENWPEHYPGWTPAQLSWYRRAERYQLRLILGRRRAGPRDRTLELDALFGPISDPVRYLAADGRYSAGTLAGAEQSKFGADGLKLPEAMAIVQQLLLWLPDDMRLRWQLAELLNAAGDITSASAVFDSFWSRNYTAPDLLSHRRIVREAVAKIRRDSSSAAGPSDEAMPNPVEQPATTRWPEVHRLALVGIACAAVVLALAYLQLREIRRRRRG